MSRAFLIVLDSVGCGGAPDAAAFGDKGANTLGHILQARQGRLHLPNLAALGLGAAMHHATGINTPWDPPKARGGGNGGSTSASASGWAVATEVSNGKDTPSGHWELAGVPVPWNWHYFPNETPAFPVSVLDKLIHLVGGSLVNSHASGIAVVRNFGAAHLSTGLPICYTSVDSVFQIAAHEERFGLERLYQLCCDLAPLLHGMKVGRVIARPFIGRPETGFQRTANRKDFAIIPPLPTLCDWVTGAGRVVHALGKIGDIFSMRGIGRCRKGTDQALMRYLADEVVHAPDGSLTFANFVEFDTLWGHPRDPEGYAQALEWFDAAIGPIIAKARPGDMFVLTADHGNDPTWPGTNHTRERVPVLVSGCDLGQIGNIRFSDVAASIADHLGVPSYGPGKSFL